MHALFESNNEYFINGVDLTTIKNEYIVPIIIVNVITLMYDNKLLVGNIIQ